MNALAQPRQSLEAFLAWENAQAERHEFFRGEVFAMVGGRRSHGRVVSNLNAALVQSLKGSACQVFAESMKVQVGDDAIVYPDLFVTCDKADLATEMIFRSPLVVVEVISPTTEAYDRGAKFALYRRLASVREYVLVDPETRRIEAFRLRADDGDWALHDMTAGPALEVASLGLAFPLDDVFAGLEPPAVPA